VRPGGRVPEGAFRRAAGAGVLPAPPRHRWDAIGVRRVRRVLANSAGPQAGSRPARDHCPVAISARLAGRMRSTAAELAHPEASAISSTTGAPDANRHLVADQPPATPRPRQVGGWSGTPGTTGFLLAASHLTRRRFGAMLRRIWALRCQPADGHGRQETISGEELAQRGRGVGEL
jgi:hypothetical protein